MHEQPDAHGERAGNRNLGGVEQGDDVPTEVLGGTGRKGGVEIASDGEEPAHDVVGLEFVRFDEGPEELVGRRENLGGVVPGDRRRSADAMKPWGGRGHAT